MLVGNGEAYIRYALSSFTVIKGGDFVTCAITGRRIALEQLRYWNADRQEAYVDGAASLEGHRRAHLGAES